jgi:hypothetical protein
MEETLSEVQDEQVIAEKEEIKDPFKQDNWADNLETVEQVKAEETTEQSTTETQTQEEKQEVLDWFKELGFESADEAKAQVTELKKVKETAPKEIEFANEESKKFFDLLKEGKEDDVYNFLAEKKKLEKYITAEINESNAAEIVKLAMQQKYKDFTPEEIEYRFRKQFSVPKEPIQSLTEDDEDFAVRKAEWQEQVSDNKRDLIIEAKLAKPELEKLKSNLVLPNIQKDAESQVQTQAQKELEQAEIDKRRNQYLSSLNSENSLFKGFETSYKNEGGDIPVSYTVTDDERKSLSKELENFDVDGFILSRWFKEDGSPNVKSLMEDVYLLRNKDKIHQKIASETGTKVIDNYIKNAKNVNVTGGNQTTFSLNQPQAEQDKATQNFFEAER